MTLFGVIGYFMRKMGVPLAPILMGLILGDDLEQNFRRTLLANDGNYGAFFDGPLNIALAIGVVVVLFLPQIIERIRGKTFRDDFADTTAEV
jgi:putative tricarboxylic transport membrane protein